MTLYDVLGVDENSTREDIKKAYRKKASENHPDRGGDEEEFKKIAHAHMILYDSEKRKRYDESGDDSGVNNDEAQFKNWIARMSQEFLQRKDTKRVNMIFWFSKKLKEQQKMIRSSIQGAEQDIKKIQDVISRLKCKEDSPILAHWKRENQKAEIQFKTANYNLHQAISFESKLDGHAYVTEEVKSSPDMKDGIRSSGNLNQSGSRKRFLDELYEKLNGFKEV